jgi:hypothetical protein
MQAIDEADPVLVHSVRRFVLRTIAQALTEDLAQVRSSLGSCLWLPALPCAVFSLLRG